MEEVVRVFKSHHIDVEVHDERTEGRQIDVSFHGELRPEQRDATERVLAYDQGILCAPTAFGKTVVGACLIAKRSVNALILVHRRQLMDQWRERLAAFLALPIGHIGQYGGGKAKRTGLIDVAVIQSLQRKGTIEDFVADYGHVIVDECHHLSAVTFERILREVKAKYVLGLTATPTRKDGHQPIIYMQCGPIRFHLSAKKAAESSPLQHKVFPRITDFGWNRSESETAIQDIYAALIDVGRLHRLHDNKSEVHVYDYADVMVPMLARMYKKRLAGYSALGYTVAETDVTNLDGQRRGVY